MNSIDKRDENGKLPLHYACMNKDESAAILIIKYLLDRGSHVNSLDNGKNTPFLIAVEKGCLETVKFLLDNGANINSCDCDGRNGLHLASKSGNSAILKYLLERGALSLINSG